MTNRFAVDDGLMSIDQALARLEARLAPVAAVETVPLRQGLFRILAEDVVAGLNVPPHDNSAVDGWAFRHADRPPDGVLPVVGRVAAGHPFAGELPAGGAVRIFTGAPLPAGADTVAMQEDCREEEGKVVLPARLKRGDNARQAGEDVTRGSVVLRAGARLRPQELGIAAAMGRAELPVYRPLRVAVFSTGDEIRDPATMLAPGCIFDSNRYTAGALLQSLGAEVTDLGILPDRLEIIQADVFKWSPSRRLPKFDTIYFDIWPDICLSNGAEANKLHFRALPWAAHHAWIGDWDKEVLQIDISGLRRRS